ncbi:MAG: RNA polymerase sigma factor [Clostridia bacterium]|nr:RNA polymerase sigma factor [Clostridia bacterium]
MDDSGIIEKYLARDESAIEATADRYGARLKELAIRMLGDEFAAEECVSDAYLAAWNSIPPNEPREYFFAYLAKTVKRSALDRLRSGRTQKRGAQLTELTREMEECIPLSADTANEAEARELSRLINGFLGGLEKQKRDIFVRRYWLLDSIKEIARDLGWSESRVKTTLFRIRGKLRSFLEAEGYTV